ncbi:MAG: hypothetical protein PHS07_01760 [Patescibacteria group bacterium]|nr:hypothetical protein [Patescibacteria group bacterium]
MLALEKLIGKIPALIARYLANKITEDEIRKKLKSFDDWLIICEKIYPSSQLAADLIALALRRMTEKAETFKQWHLIHKHSNKGSRFQKRALEEMAERASSLEEWAILYELATPKTKFMTTTLQKLGEFEDAEASDE